MIRKVKEMFRRFWQKMGIAGNALLIMVTFITISVIVYHAAGMGKIPSVDLKVVASNSNVMLVVLDGEVPAGDWEYLVFNERVNPPIKWAPAPADMEPGESIMLASELPPATYRVQIRHKPSSKFIFETKVKVKE